MRRTILTVFGGYGLTSNSGAERMAWRTTAQLSVRGHRVAALTTSVPPESVGIPEWPVFRSAVELADWLPDVVHAYDLFKPDHVELARRLADRFGARLALTPASAPEVWPDPAVGAALCCSADVLYALTRAEVAAMEGMGVEPTRVRMLPQAPDLVGVADPAARARIGGAGHLVTFLGRRVAAKGYRVLLDAAPLVWRHLPETTFLFGGPDGEPEAAGIFARHRDRRVVDAGMLGEQDKHDVLAASDVVCLPSSADVLPLVFAEAWACGKPVVSGRFPGVEEAVRHGVDGLVVDAGPAEVAQALVSLLRDEPARRALGEAGRRRVEREMGWDRVADAVEAGHTAELGGRA
jgi:glycosyltransferase involved in cell wall biosynthesis